MDGFAWTDATIVPLADARVPLLDRGHLLGDGVFETIRVAGGEPFRLEAHLNRMADGMQTAGLGAEAIPLIAEATNELVAHGLENLGSELYVRIQATAGAMQDLTGIEGGLHVTGMVKRFQPYPMRHYSHGIKAVLAPQRKHRDDPMSGVKSTSFAGYVAARRYALGQAVHDAIIRNDAGRVAEASTSNVFAVHGDTIYAPGATEAALAGITREAVLELVNDTGLPTETKLDVPMLQSAEEAFVTNTIGGVIPLTQFEGKPIGSGKKGALTTRLGHALDAMVHGE